jgi:hypothetical protein
MKRLLFTGAFFLFSCLLMLLSGSSNGQQPALSVTQLLMPDTVNEFQPYGQLSVTINNSSNGNFYDSLYIMMQQDTTASSPDTLYIGVDSIAAGNTITINLPVHIFTQQYYKTGGNTVVVWPVGKNAVTVDSLLDFFYLVPLGGIADPADRESKLLLFPNPATSYVIIDGENSGGYVRIFNVEGRLACELPCTGRRLDLSTLKAGIYYVEYSLRNTIHYKKLVKL